MKKISKRIIRKIITEGTMDTKNYRYELDGHKIIACEMSKIGELECLEPGAWETVYQF